MPKKAKRNIPFDKTEGTRKLEKVFIRKLKINDNQSNIRTTRKSK